MSSRESAVAIPCPGERPAPDFLLFDEARSQKPPVCPRTIEILTVLNEVFDALMPDECGMVAEPA